MDRLPISGSSVAGTVKRARRLIVAAASLGFLFAATPGSSAEEPLAGVAYTYADAAYRAYKIGDYATTIAKTRQVIAIRPDSARMRALLIDAFFAQGNIAEADMAASEAVSRFPDDADLLARQRNIREQIANKTKIDAFRIADEGFKAFDQKDYTTAAQDARKAIALDTSKQLYRILLVNSLITADDLDEANKEVTEALVSFDNDPELLDRQQYIRQQIAGKPLAEAYVAADAAYKAFAQKNYATAVKQARIAIELDPANRSYHDLLQNAERAQRRPVTIQSRGAILAQRGYADQRRGDFTAAISDFTAALRSGLPTPMQTRNVRLALADSYLGAGNPQRAMDTLAPFADSSYDMGARRGFALQALKRSPEALDSFTSACASARSPRELAIALSARIALLAEMKRKEEARALFDQSLANGELRPLSSADIANLALTVGNDQVANQFNAQAYQEKLLRGRSVMDAGYLAARISRTKEAIGYFKSAIDAHYAGDLPLDPQELFAIRRQIAEMSRTWGAYASLTYSKTGAGPGAAFAGSPSGSNSLQPGIELYWRPTGYEDGRYVDVFFRAFETSYAQNGGATGVKTTQGLYGLRFKPIGPVDLVLEVAHVFPLGDLARNDMLLRAAFFHGQGTDLRVDTWTWPTWQIYADFNRFMESGETVASADLRIGQSYRLDAINRNLVLFPHVGVFASYDNKLATAGAYSAGPGATLRYWFREDKYTAPMSYLDLTAQYRFRLGGDRRAEGPFGQVLVNY
jgi:tetratricopeptide (TPR) repeat protein